MQWWAPRKLADSRNIAVGTSVHSKSEEAFEVSACNPLTGLSVNKLLEGQNLLSFCKSLLKNNDHARKISRAVVAGSDLSTLRLQPVLLTIFGPKGVACLFNL